MVNLEAAKDKHDDGKYDCAMKQLGIFIGKVEALFDAGKISEIDRDNLIGHANAAIESIEILH